MDTKKLAKYKAAILYFAKNLNSYQLGKTKLAKLLYYLDFISYRDRQKTVTGTLYYKQEFGPLARDLTEIIGTLVDEKDLEIQSVVVNGGVRKDKFIAKQSPDESVFDEYELTLMRKLVNEYANIPTDVIVAKTHLEAPWVKATNGAMLDFKYAFDIEDFDDEVEIESKIEDQKIIEAVQKELAKE